MKKILFYAGIYWDIHWLYNVIKAVDGEVYTTNGEARDVCEKLGIKLATGRDNYQVVVVTNTHLGGHNDIAEHYLRTGGQVVILQHAWDSDVHTLDRFWARDMSRFSFYYVGSTQDYNMLSSKRGTDIIKLTGIPKFDDLYRVKHSRKKLTHIYEKLGVDKFLLATAPTDVITKGLYNKYRDQLEGESTIPIVFKCHPGGNHNTTMQQYRNEGKSFRLVDDDRYDLLNTYELIKASSGVVCLESFISIEASLLGKPVVFYGNNEIPPDFYNKEENKHQVERTSPAMSSSLDKLEYKPEQKRIADMYLFDGKNTERVVSALQTL